MKLHPAQLALAALLACACAVNRSAPARTSEPAASAEAAAPAAEPPARPADPPSVTAPAPNRDPHGERDTQNYIARLSSPDRVAELQVQTVVDTLAPAADAVVGDLGCGPGLFALAFARACPAGVVYASDIEPAQLDALRARLLADGVENVVPVLSSPGDPHFPPRGLDLVFLADTYHHLRDRVAYMRRLQRTLAPDGRLAILEYKPGKLPVGPPPEHKLAAGVREQELEEAGYARVATFATHAWHDFEIWRVAPLEGRAGLGAEAGPR